jgi:hypothetical protein
MLTAVKPQNANANKPHGQDEAPVKVKILVGRGSRRAAPAEPPHLTNLNLSINRVLPPGSEIVGIAMFW